MRVCINQYVQETLAAPDHPESRFPPSLLGGLFYFLLFREFGRFARSPPSPMGTLVV